MPPTRSSSRTFQPVQRRPRRDKACTFCRMAKQRCESLEYGTNDRPCRRCDLQNLECSIGQAAHTQNPSSEFGAQGPGPLQYLIAPHSAGGATEELTPGSETSVQHTLQQSESLRVPMGEWPPHMMRSDERQGSSSNVFLVGQTLPQTPSFLSLAPSMEGYQGFPNVAQGSTGLASSYYPHGYYSQTTYIYAPQSANDDGANLGYVMPQPDNRGEQDGRFFES